MLRREYLQWWLRPAFLRPWGRRSKTLFAGPWLGEFGWELLCWQGFVRKVSRGYERTVVYCPAGREALYADFADTVIPHAFKGTSETDRCVGDRMAGHSLHLLGDQAGAYVHLERMLANYVSPATGSEPAMLSPPIINVGCRTFGKSDRRSSWSMMSVRRADARHGVRPLLCISHS